MSKLNKQICFPKFNKNFNIGFLGLFCVSYLSYFCGMQKISFYHSAFIAHLEENVQLKEPASLYDPIFYNLELGGKRLRPILTLMTAEAFGEDYKKALDAAL